MAGVYPVLMAAARALMSRISRRGRVRNDQWPIKRTMCLFGRRPARFCCRHALCPIASAAGKDDIDLLAGWPLPGPVG